MSKRKQQKVYGIIIDTKLKELRKRDYLRFLKEIQERVITKHRLNNLTHSQVKCKNQ